MNIILFIVQINNLKKFDLLFFSFFNVYLGKLFYSCKKYVIGVVL